MSGATEIASLPLVVTRFDTAFPKGPALGAMNRITWRTLEKQIGQRREGPKDGDNIVLARFQPEPDGRARRLKRNVLARTAIALDIETNKGTGEIPPPMAEAAERLRAQGWGAILYTSHSHAPEAPRYRILIPLSDEIPPELPAVEVVADILVLSGVMDRSKLGAASLFYLPSAAPGHMADHAHIAIDGTAIDAAWMLARAGAVLAAREAEQAQQRKEALAAAEARHAARIAKGYKPTDNLIEKIRDRLDLASQLQQHGYEKVGDKKVGDKYLFPGSQTGVPGVHILRGNDGVERVYSHHAGDPLAAGNLPTWCPDAVDVVDVVTILDHGGDQKAALHKLAMQFGIESKPRPASAPPPEWDDIPPPDEELNNNYRGQGRSKMPRDVEDFGRALPTIDVVAGQLDQLATEAETALRQSGLPVFQRGASIVVPVSHEVPASGGRMTVTAGLKELTTPGLIDHLSQAARFQRFNIRNKKMMPCDPPHAVASIIASRFGSWTFASVAGVITTPTMRPDGSILTEPGYDPPTRLYHVADPTLRLPTVPFAPTGAQARAALELLDGLLDEFPFVAPVDRSVALSGLITPVVRGRLPVAPMHGFTASTAGTGKSYVVDLASGISAGRPCPALTPGDRDEETEKRLVGMLLAAFPIISLDNVNGELGGDLLCQAIERPLVRVRALGASEIMEIESRATIFANGNGLRVRGDMTRRTIICTLDCNMERPELREFKQDPLQRVLDNRGEYVAACLTIVRAYLAAGSPNRLKPIASFQDWSDTVRSALVWLGKADPVETMETARADDPELSELKQVMGAWFDTYGDADLAVRTVSEDALERTHNEKGDLVPRRPALRDALLTVAGGGDGINAKRFGRWLLRHEGRIVRIADNDNASAKTLKFRRKGTVGGVAIWKCVQVV